ncbi:MAG: 5-carboxymethyl-2-hydroxymuconate Delta-isomerase [Ferruginibacter sp.]
MPHFVIDCSDGIITPGVPGQIMKTVHDTAESTGLFAKGDIKVRITHYEYFNVGNDPKDFIHVFGYIMEGRNTEQKNDLSRRIVSALKAIFPDVPIISMNVMDFEKATYCNRTMV